MVRLGQNFLTDTNLLDAIVRDAALEPNDVVLEIGGGEGALSERIAPLVSHLHTIEIDQSLAGELEEIAARHANVSLIRGDAMRVRLERLDPAPTTVTSNLPYSIATPAILKTIEELPGVRSWTVMVQHEIAERLRSRPGSREYGAPSVLVQLACDVERLRAIDRAVFRPRPRVDSALLRLVRRRPAAPVALRRLVREAFAHRRKSLAGSLELAGGPPREATRAALRQLGLDENVRAEALAPSEFAALAERLEAR